MNILISQCRFPEFRLLKKQHVFWERNEMVHVGGEKSHICKLIDKKLSQHERETKEMDARGKKASTVAILEHFLHMFSSHHLSC